MTTEYRARENKKKGGVEKLTRYRVQMEIPEGKIDEIMTRLENAQEEIYKCYDELVQLGVLNVIPADVEEKAATEQSDGQTAICP